LSYKIEIVSAYGPVVLAWIFSLRPSVRDPSHDRHHIGLWRELESTSLCLCCMQVRSCPSPESCCVSSRFVVVKRRLWNRTIHNFQYRTRHDINSYVVYRRLLTLESKSARELFSKTDLPGILLRGTYHTLSDSANMVHTFTHWNFLILAMLDGFNFHRDSTFDHVTKTCGIEEGHNTASKYATGVMFLRQYCNMFDSLCPVTNVCWKSKWMVNSAALEKEIQQLWVSHLMTIRWMAALAGAEFDRRWCQMWMLKIQR